METRYLHPTKILLTTGLVLGPIACDLMAQSLGQQDLLPAIGATWHMRALQSIPSDELPIEPIVWPYGSLIGNDLFGTTYTVLEPAEVSGGSGFPAADRAVRNVPDNNSTPTYVFYDVQDDKCLELGSLSPILSTHFDPGAMVQAYPMSLGEVVTGNFCFTSSSAGGVFDYCGTTRITLEAIGTLELVFGTFENVQLVSARRATALVGSEDTTVTITRDWFAEGIPYPLLHFVSVVNPDGSTARSGQILDESSIVGVPDRAADPVLDVFPNPTTGRLFVRTDGGSEIEIWSADGRAIRTHRIDRSQGNTIAMDLGDLPEGIYRVVSRGKDARRSTKVVVAR